MKVKTILCAILSWLMVLVMGIALVGAFTSYDPIFKICGGLGILIWFAIVIKTIRANDPTDISNHPNHL